MSKKYCLQFRKILNQKAFTAISLAFVFTLSSCDNEVRLKGIVIDDINHLPVVNAKVKTITGVIGRSLEFAEVYTNKAGVFEIVFKSNQVTAEKLSVEVSKVNYLSNVFEVTQHSLDTIVLHREIHFKSDLLSTPNN